LIPQRKRESEEKEGESLAPYQRQLISFEWTRRREEKPQRPSDNTHSATLFIAQILIRPRGWQITK